MDREDIHIGETFKGGSAVKRPVTVLLLVVFAAVQLYLAKVPATHQVQGSSWILVSPSAGGLVRRQGRYFLVTPKTAFPLKANGAHITAAAGEPLTWLDIPEPSGQGVWRLAIVKGNLPLVGIGSPVFPSPNGQTILWLDQGTGLLYQSAGPEGPLRLLTSKMRAVGRVVWAPDSHAVALTGQGPQGHGVYVWDQDHNLTPVAIAAGAAPKVVAMGFTRQELLLVAFNQGQILWQGHGRLPLPDLQPVAVAPDQASVLGLTANHVVFWHETAKKVYQRPDLAWQSPVRFSVNGQTASVLARSMDGHARLLLYGPATHLEVSLPYSGATYHLIGFVGDHWVLVTVPAGPHEGTYAWWVQ